MSQLRAAYGKDESLTGNCGVQLAFPPAKLETAEHLSRMTGQTTVVRERDVLQMAQPARREILTAPSRD